jgi:O-acetylhomoserine/O-acetylserine sulfhydrylase
MKTTKKNNPVKTSASALHDLIDHMQLTDYSVKDKKYILLPQHPNVSYLEEKIKELEGGANAMVLESLTIARYLLFKSLLKPGDNIVSFNSWSLYFNDEPEYKNSGISIRLSVDGKIDTFLSLIDQRTKIIYLETVSNEFFNIPDFRKITAIAREKNIPVVVDNTAAGPGYLTSPIRYGANIVLLDTAPWLLQNRKYAGAVIIEDGTYNWRNSKFDHLLNQEQFRKLSHVPGKPHLYFFSILDYIRSLSFVRNIDLTVEPDWQYDIENIDYILFRKSENTGLLCNWLKKHSYVDSVNYMGFAENEHYNLANTFFKGGFGNTFSFRLNTDLISYEYFLKRFLEKEVPPYLFSVYYDSDRSILIVSTGYGDFEEIKKTFYTILNTSEKYFPGAVQIHGSSHS